MEKLSQANGAPANPIGDLQEELRRGWPPLPFPIVLSLVAAGLKIRLSRSVVTMLTVVLAIAFLTYTGLFDHLVRNLSQHALNLTSAPWPSQVEVREALRELRQTDFPPDPVGDPARWLPLWLQRSSEEIRELRRTLESVPGTNPGEMEAINRELRLRNWMDGNLRTDGAGDTTAEARTFFHQQAAALLPTFLAPSSWSSVELARARFLMELPGGESFSNGSLETLRRVLEREEMARSGARLTAMLRAAGVNPESALEGDRSNLWVIAMALLLCAVGIANAMLMNVTERFREIGTMKCLGARDGLVVKIFLLESAFLGVTGAALGIVLGAFVVLAAGFLQFGQFTLGNFPLGQSVPVMGLSMLAGIFLAVAGTAYPAILAARMKPVDALRVEE